MAKQQVSPDLKVKSNIIGLPSIRCSLFMVVKSTWEHYIWPTYKVFISKIRFQIYLRARAIKTKKDPPIIEPVHRGMFGWLFSNVSNVILLSWRIFITNITGHSWVNYFHVGSKKNPNIPSNSGVVSGLGKIRKGAGRGGSMVGGGGGGGGGGVGGGEGV